MLRDDAVRHRDAQGTPNAIHLDRRRAAAFGSVADRYDRARPSYPTALVGELMARQPRSVLDVGCGTGKAARLFAEQGCDVLGVEPDARMAAVARAHGLAVEKARFEKWDAKGRTFDLVISAQAWHWVDPGVGPPKAGSVLRAGGQLAVFWNSSNLSDEVRSALDQAYQRHAPELARTTTALGMAATDGSEHLAAIRAAGCFTEPQQHEYHWQLEYSRDEWLDLLETHSDHLLLGAARRQRLTSAIRKSIDQLGESLLVRYRTGLLLATRVVRSGA